MKGLCKCQVLVSAWSLLKHETFFIYLCVLAACDSMINFNEADMVCKALDSVTLKATSTNMQAIAQLLLKYY